MKCNYCSGICIKKGWYKQVQKYQCKGCKKYQQSAYVYRKYELDICQQVVSLNNEGVGISSISRLLQIPKTSVLRRILTASLVFDSKSNKQRSDYEIDELYTYIGNKDVPCYVIYAIDRTTGKIIDFVTGARTKVNIQQLTKRLLSLAPRKIYTDKLNVFSSLIPSVIHCTLQYKTNRIERKNLTI